MLEYLRDRVKEKLEKTHSAILATGGPAGVQVSYCPGQGLGLHLFLLVPATSDHLFNLENQTEVVVTTEDWQLIGWARVLKGENIPPELELKKNENNRREEVIEIVPYRFEFIIPEETRVVETIDL